MREQYGIETLEGMMISTKNLAFAVREKLQMHIRLTDILHQHLDVTYSGHE
ncbi:hypothetical protein SAY86_016390 [Trapa natans]|uniref:Uncharacterized protein n=1 Tax=Trapa natans TaxID=22666 RepID=A0AAN7LFZ1_TRANT|nr:hypothetical protein SAY86_016390 [Trapa natans]